MKCYLATFFRWKWLYLLVLLIMLAASAVGTYYLSHSQYESTAQIYVDTPALNNVLDQKSVSYGFVKTPAQEQADKLHQLLQSDDFIKTMLKRTALAGEFNGVPEHEERIITAVRKRLMVVVYGPNGLKISFSGPDPVLCQQIVEATMDRFRGWSLEVQLGQTAVELRFYQDMLKIYDDQIIGLTRRIEALQRDYPSGVVPASTPQYTELQRLERELETALDLQSTTKLKIDQTSLVNSLSSANKQVQFQILDKPSVPTLPAVKLTKMVKYFGLGVAASGMLFLAAIILGTWQDTALRTVDDVRKLGKAPVLAVIPKMKTATETRSWRRAGRGSGRQPLLVRTQQGAGD